MISFNSALPLDFENAEWLKRVDQTTVKVTNTNSCASEGETLTYHFNKSGDIEYVNDQGTKCLPVAARDKMWKHLSRIEQPKS